MLFEDALKELRNGKSIRRSIWMKVYKYSLLSDDDGFLMSKYDLLQEDWEVVEEPGKTFPEVFEAFKEGKKIKRKAWNRYLQNNMFDTFHMSDLLANDWIIVE